MLLCVTDSSTKSSSVPTSTPETRTQSPSTWLPTSTARRRSGTSLIPTGATYPQGSACLPTCWLQMDHSAACNGWGSWRLSCYLMISRVTTWYVMVHGMSWYISWYRMVSHHSLCTLARINSTNECLLFGDVQHQPIHYHQHHHIQLEHASSTHSGEGLLITQVTQSIECYIGVSVRIHAPRHSCLFKC